MMRFPLVFCCLVATSIAAAEKAPPNVLLIVCDDLNTRVSTSGYEPIDTPNFERLAAAGVTFNRAYCQYPVCGPSRASFLSGLYPESTGVVDNSSDIRQTRPGTVSLPQRFKESGYWTAAVGKVFHTPRHDPGDIVWDENRRFENDEMPMVTPLREAFEAEHGPITRGKARKKWRAYYPTIAPQTRNQNVGYGPSSLRDEQHKDGKNARRVSAWIDERAHGERPFFLVCGIQKPHVPFLAPDAYFERYPKPELRIEAADPAFWDQAPRMAMHHRYTGFGFELGVENDALRRDYTQAYHACVSFIDAQIGLMLDALERAGRWDDTIIVLTSDHGYHLGEKSLWGKVTLFETCDRVPLVVRAPGVSQAKEVSEGLVELVDLYPTLAELCGVSPPAELQGQSFAPLLSDPTLAGKPTAYTVVGRGRHGLGRAIRTERWRYARWPVGEELYDLANDPDESVNLAETAERASLLESLREELVEFKVFASARRR